jgi:hypothetical protein
MIMAIVPDGGMDSMNAFMGDMEAGAFCPVKVILTLGMMRSRPGSNFLQK